MTLQTDRRIVRVALLFALACLGLVVPRVALAQPPANQMCGDGTTFTVALPGLDVLPLNGRNPDDSITLPNGCSIYALFVSGYQQNPNLDELLFYKAAKFVAENNGYVHYAWWNNILKEYMAGPAHDLAVTLPLPPPFNLTVRPNPGGLLGSHGPGFIPDDTVTLTELFPKALPDEDIQFQADARRMLQAIRAHNPDAIIVVAGHSMGGEAVARLGTDTTEVIDLLAPIDPVGNRTLPVGRITNRSYNWTRWRVAQAVWGGYRQADCIRIGPFPLPCRDFDSRLFHVERRCEPNGVGPLLDRPPLIASRAPLSCPGPWVDPGQRRTIRANVRHLLHRWQKEFAFPFDYNTDQPLRYLGRDTTTTAGPVIQAQQALAENGLAEFDPQKTCSTLLKIDPRDPDFRCSPGDGHGEIVGMRGTPTIPIGVTARHWPTTAAGRREKLIEMANTSLAPPVDPTRTSADADRAGVWLHEPVNPNLCMVSDDMIRILDTILDRRTVPPPLDTTAPVSVADISPDANEAGWHNGDAIVTLNASDETDGSGVREIVYALSGAQPAAGMTPGTTTSVAITAEGHTVVRFNAIDVAGNPETEKMAEVRIDRTPPAIAAIVDPPAPNGWHRTDVTVNFAAADGLSGLASSAPAVVVSSEGANQEITGAVTDLAGNSAAASAILNIDKTAPTVEVTTPQDGAVFLLNAMANAGYGCSDALSGITTCVGTVPAGAAIATSAPGSHAFVVESGDTAGNSTSVTRKYSVQYAFSGFGRPIDAGATNVAKAGRTVPVKYSLSDATGALVSDLTSFVSLRSIAVGCDGSSSGAEVEDTDAAGDTSIRYDALTGEFQYNWKTEGGWAGSCRTLELTLKDGTRHRVMFQFR
jgi:pimeloyl-ACP methyl ester carboxylesterase